jgi:hypothetical protein
MFPRLKPAELSIEIADATVLGWICAPIGATDAINAQAENIRLAIRNALTPPAGCPLWTTINVIRYGPEDKTHLPAARIVISIDPAIESAAYCAIQRQLRSVCAAFSNECSAPILLRGQAKRYCRLDREQHRVEAGLGASIGSALRKTAPAGSLGGFITLRSCAGDERRFGLTCWHVVRGGEQASPGNDLPG